MCCSYGKEFVENELGFGCSQGNSEKHNKYEIKDSSEPRLLKQHVDFDIEYPEIDAIFKKQENEENTEIKFLKPRQYCVADTYPYYVLKVFPNPNIFDKTN